MAFLLKTFTYINFKKKTAFFPPKFGENFDHRYIHKIDPRFLEKLVEKRKKAPWYASTKRKV
jgi:hypothetical protein